MAYLATTTMGAVIVPLLPDFSATEIRNILDHAQAKVVFVSRTLAEKIKDVGERMTVSLNDFDGLPDADSGDGGEATYDGGQPPAEDDIAAIIYTSGTTGRSKGVMLTHAGIISNVEAARPLADANPETGEGEIQVRGPNVMKGYYRDSERTAECFTEDGWFRTGDLGTIDEKKRLFIRGRLKNVIVEPSGKNIYPEELEALINTRRLISESLVVKQGQRLVALVNVELDSLREQLGEISCERLKQEATAYLERVRAEVNAQLSSFARISRFVLQEEPFEKTPTMKIKRYLYDRIAENGG